MLRIWFGVLVMSDHKPHRILVVDDDHDIVEVSSLLLAALGHECRTATTGRDALEVLDRFAPDIVILDIGLPDISGYELASLMRARVGQSVYLAALTGWNGADELAHMNEVGFNQSVLKPTDREKLRSIVRSAEAPRPLVRQPAD